MRYLQHLSLAITAAGILLAVLAGVLGWGALWLLIGIMLAWAGLIKVVVVAIWRHTGVGVAPPTDNP